MPRKEAPHRAAISRVGGLSHRPADDPALIAARQEMLAAKLATHIKAVLDQAPPLTDEQRTRLAELLLVAGGGRDA